MWEALNASVSATHQIITGSQADPDCPSVPASERVDCGWPDITAAKCEEQICCYLVDSSSGVPPCFYKIGKSNHNY